MSNNLKSICIVKRIRKGSSTMNNDLDKAEKKWHDPEDSSNPYLYDDYVEEDGNYYSKSDYDAMYKADEEED